MTRVNLPGQFVSFWQGSDEYRTPESWLSEGAEAFRRAFDAGVYRGRGTGFSVAVDVTPGPVLEHLEQLAGDFAAVCSPGSDHTRLEARASRTLNLLLAWLREEFGR